MATADNPETLPVDAAARHLAHAVGKPRSGSLLLVCSGSKRDFAGQVAAALKDEGVAAYVLEIPAHPEPNQYGPVSRLIREIAPDWGLRFLVSPRDARFLFDVVGRPDTGMKVHSQHFFSDFCMSLPGFIRTQSADP